jgi:hypothetical protein
MASRESSSATSRPRTTPGARRRRCRRAAADGPPRSRARTARIGRPARARLHDEQSVVRRQVEGQVPAPSRHANYVDRAGARVTLPELPGGQYVVTFVPPESSVYLGRIGLRPRIHKSIRYSGESCCQGSNNRLGGSRQRDGASARVSVRRFPACPGGRHSDRTPCGSRAREVGDCVTKGAPLRRQRRTRPSRAVITSLVRSSAHTCL